MRDALIGLLVIAFIVFFWRLALALAVGVICLGIVGMVLGFILEQAAIFGGMITAIWQEITGND